MKSAIGMIEMKTVSSGITAADAMLKTAAVEILEAQAVCPGKYTAVIKGSLSAVNASIDVVRTNYSANLISSFILGNPHESIFPAIYGAANIEQIDALGILETYDASSIIVAADTAAKTACIELIEIRIAKGLCGKSYLLLSGEVAAVEAAVEAAKQSAARECMFLDASVIPYPDRELCRTIL